MQSDGDKYISKNIKDIARKMQGNSIYLPRRYSTAIYLPRGNRDYDQCLKFASAIENVNINEFIDENKQKLENMHLLHENENSKIEGGTIEDIFNFIKEKVSILGPELLEKIKALPKETNTLQRALATGISENSTIEPLVNYLSRDNGYLTNNHKLAIENALKNYDPIRDNFLFDFKPLEDNELIYSFGFDKLFDYMEKNLPEIKKEIDCDIDYHGGTVPFLLFPDMIEKLMQKIKSNGIEGGNFLSSIFGFISKNKDLIKSIGKITNQALNTTSAVSNAVSKTADTIKNINDNKLETIKDIRNNGSTSDVINSIKSLEKSSKSPPINSD